MVTWRAQWYCFEPYKSEDYRRISSVFPYSEAWPTFSFQGLQEYNGGSNESLSSALGLPVQEDSTCDRKARGSVYTFDTGTVRVSDVRYHQDEDGHTFDDKLAAIEEAAQNKKHDLRKGADHMSWCANNV